MPQAEESQVVVELTHHTFHALRLARGTVEAGGGCVLENKASLEALLDSVAPSWKTGVVRASAAVWPDGAAWHLSNDTEALLDRSAEALRAIASSGQSGYAGALAYAACGAADGGALTIDGTDKWLLASMPAESLARVSTNLGQLKIVSDGTAPAAFPAISAAIAALRAAGAGSVALWDLGTERSHLLLITEKGVEGVAACDLGLQAVFEAIQQTLRLKFRGAGERLFFNETYDFTEHGPKVAALVGARVKLALEQLVPSGATPPLAGLGLAGRQAWFVKEVAGACATTAWEPDMAALASGLGLRFAKDGVGASLSVASLGLLGQAALLSQKSEAWQPAWVAVEAAEPEVEAPPAAPAEPVEPEEPQAIVPKPAAPPARARPTLSLEPEASQAPFAKKPAKPPVTVKPSGSAPPGVTFSPPAPAAPPAGVPPASPRPAMSMRPVVPLPKPPSAAPDAPSTRSAPSFPAPQGEAQPPAFPRAAFPTPKAEPLPAAPAPSFSHPAFPAPHEEPVPAPAGHAPSRPVAAVPEPAAATPAVPPPPAVGAAVQLSAGATPPPAVTALPFEAVKHKAAVAAPEVPAAEAPPKSKVGFYIGVGVAAALVFAGIAVVVDAHLEKIKANDLEQQEALAHHVAEQRLKEAEESAREQDERHRKELETAIEITRKQTEEETRRQVLAEVEEERLAKLPGTIVLATVPAGASVSVDGAAPQTSPVKIDGVAPGTHRIHVSLAGHDSVDLTASVKGSKTIDLGTITLESSLGALGITSNPDDLAYEVRPAGEGAAKPLRSGRTPADIEDLPHGDYVITFTRPGCRDHTEKVTVRKGGHATVSTTYQNGSLELTSDPSGAWVDKDGTRLGTTPLFLNDLTPKKASFELTLPGYDPTPVDCEIPEGQTLKLQAQLLRRDRIFKLSEVKEKPVAEDAPPPSLSPAERKVGAEVLISAVVRRDGSVTDIEVTSATDDDVGRRCKAAVEDWRYQPATAPDGRTVDSRIDITFKFPAQN